MEVIGENYFGSGRSLGISAPIVTETTITNRLLNYITFETSGVEVELMKLNIAEVSIMTLYSFVNVRIKCNFYQLKFKKN